ncbi:MAG: hypothetical protein A3C06_04545 [Candidatus Taylorbacteria bacterium RIFCSPHIGHO2_02_FULL_46_13]|uniref:Uncharacterized protein n=1 Tax=Candidatus Taylorbacteria bacterium RIFCSPHIGHO2_02_FULL_46_13 TaxID=1802312 RepID=A0A1G2MTC4_9BACT|nr:MAG: hypothetical protein A3C06_04545 [Candidatus Taylorbacteria bacterium RIFCSPHIGHO2_02_FULL_46_13]
MSKNTLVTSNQTDAVRDMANAKGVTRAQFQSAQDDGRIARFLDSLRGDSCVIPAPSGACIHTVRIRFKPDSGWQEAVNAAGPNTPSEYNIRKVGDQYPPTGTEEIEEDLILLNYPKGDGNWNTVHAWAVTQNLTKTVPREVFALGEQHPKLHEVLGQNPMYAVATTECSFGGGRGACYVWWVGSGRGAGLVWVDNFGDASGWFVFRQ